MSIILYELCGLDETHLFSPHCWKTRMSLKHKGLDYESVATPFTKITDIEGGVTNTVPLLNDNGHIFSDSYEIAKYLDEAYSDRPTLLAGDTGTALTCFIINWSQSQLHPVIGALAMKDIHDILGDVDKTYFREDRESKLNMTLEELHSKREEKIETFKNALMPLNLMLKRQPYIGGETPLFADYVVFGALQWLRMTCTLPVLSGESEVPQWFNKLLNMYGGMGRSARSAI